MIDDQPDPTSQAEAEEAKPAATEPVSPEARAKAEPAKEAVKEAVGEITTPEEAQQVAETVLDAAAGPTERDIREEAPAEAEPG
jgi:hypothetical protein